MGKSPIFLASSKATEFAGTFKGYFQGKGVLPDDGSACLSTDNSIKALSIVIGISLKRCKVVVEIDRCVPV